MLVGGMLLDQDTDAEITEMLNVLEKQHHLARKAVRQCTGEREFLLIHQERGKKDEYTGLGETGSF